MKTANNGGNVATDETTDGSLDVETDCGKNGEAAAAEVAEDLTANKGQYKVHRVLHTSTIELTQETRRW